MILTDFAPILRMILADPADDGPRLVMADYLEETGLDCERAEFIRVQCRIAEIGRELRSEVDCDLLHCEPCRERESLRVRERELLQPHRIDGWLDVPDCSTYLNDGSDSSEWPIMWTLNRGPNRSRSRMFGRVSRGFVCALRCETAWLLGGPCERCGGSGEGGPSLYCRHCAGSGRTEGHAAALFASHPIAAVTLTDREPACQQVEGYWFWVWPDPPATDTLEDQAYFVPEPLAAILRKGPYEFSTRDDAHTALSVAVVTHGRGLVGLPELEAAS